MKRSGLVIFLWVLLGAVSLIRIAITHKGIEDIDLPLIEILTQIETNQLEQSILLEHAIRYAQEGDNVDLARINFIKSDSAFRYLAKAVDEDLLSADEQVSLYEDYQSKSSSYDVKEPSLVVEEVRNRSYQL
ncbi:MAG: hypothetical protein GY816_09185 [Cytophagales bacterium]|nr:hypothetical protein [Cytophagales bacterium]